VLHYSHLHHIDPSLPPPAALLYGNSISNQQSSNKKNIFGNHTNNQQLPACWNTRIHTHEDLPISKNDPPQLEKSAHFQFQPCAAPSDRMRLGCLVLYTPAPTDLKKSYVLQTSPKSASHLAINLLLLHTTPAQPVRT
jgi:hypothetical protein